MLFRSVADRPWWMLAYMGSSRLRFDGSSCRDSEFDVSLMGFSRGGGFGSRKSSGCCERERDVSVENALSSRGVFVNRDHHESERRIVDEMGGFASRIDEGRRGDERASCELRELSEETGGVSNAPCDESELDEGVILSVTVAKEGFSDTGVSRETSSVAGATRLYKYGLGGGSLRKGAPWISTASSSKSSSPGILKLSTS